MQHLIRNNSPYTVIILFIFALIIKMQALAAPQLPAMPPGHLLYASVVSVLDVVLRGSAFAYTMLSVIMLFLQALYINSVSYKYKLFAKPTYIVAFLYLVFTSLSREFNYFGVMLLLNWCLIGALDILLGFHHAAQPRKHIFNGGFVLSLAAILHFPAAVYLVMLFFAFSLLRSFNVGEWVVGMLGFITPLYFFAGILFLYDALPELKHWPQIGLSFQKINSTLYMTGTIAGMSILTLAGLFKLQGHLNKVSVFMRRNWVLIMISLVISIFVATSTPVTLRSEWLTVMLPLSLIVAHAVYIEKNKAFSNFVFYFTLALLIFCQFTF